MGRYIDADELKKKIESIQEVSECGKSIPDEVFELIDNAPTVEVYTKDDMEREYRRGITDAYRDNPPI